jgi:hypothetical protein
MVEFICADDACVNAGVVTEWPNGTLEVFCVCGAPLTPEVQ